MGGDFALPQTTGPKPRGTDVMGRYFRRVVQTVHHDEVVSRRLIEVTHLQRPPAALLRPAIARRVLLGRPPTLPAAAAADRTELVEA